LREIATDDHAPTAEESPGRGTPLHSEAIPFSRKFPKKSAVTGSDVDCRR
jgi:hypothetical protein